MTTTVVEKVKSPWQQGQEMDTYDPRTWRLCFTLEMWDIWRAYATTLKKALRC